LGGFDLVQHRLIFAVGFHLEQLIFVFRQPALNRRHVLFLGTTPVLVISQTLAHLRHDPTRGVQALIERLEAEGIPAGPIYTYDQAFADPQVRHREMAVEVKHPAAGLTRVLGIPIKLSETPGAIRRPAPILGQHTPEILDELGYTTAEQERLKASGVI
jgi:hypothetical protein